MIDGKFGRFVCKRCGKCCRTNEGVLFDGFLNEEWVPIIEYMKERYPNGITIKNKLEGIKWTGKIESLDDILTAKSNNNSELHWALDLGLCPFFKKKKGEKRYCEIYAIRPSVCRDYRCDLSGDEWKEYIGYKPPKLR